MTLIWHQDFEGDMQVNGKDTFTWSINDMHIDHAIITIMIQLISTMYNLAVIYMHKAIHILARN